MIALSLGIGPSTLEAALDVTIGTGVTSGGYFQFGRWYPTASPCHINVNDLIIELSDRNVRIDTVNGSIGAESGDVIIAATVPVDNLPTTIARTLTINAQRNITINGAISQAVAGGDNLPNPLSLVLNGNQSGGGTGTVSISNSMSTSGGGITISSAGLTLANAVFLDTSGGAISATLSGSATLGAATITTSGGAINMTAGGTSEVRAGMFTSGGNITLTTSGNHTVYSTLDARGGANTGAVDVRSTSGFLTLSSPSYIAAGTSSMAKARASQKLTVSGPVIGGSVWVEAEGGIHDTEVTSTGSLASSNGAVTIRAGNHVTLSGSASANGPLDVAADTNAGGVGDALIAATVSTQGHPINLSAQTVAFSNNVTTSGGGITISSAALTLANAAVLNTAGGAFNATLSGSVTMINGNVNTSGGALSITAGGTGSIAAYLFSNGGPLTLTITGNLSVGGTLDARLGANTGSVSVRSTTGTLTLSGTSQVLAGSGATASLRSSQKLTVSGPVSGGSVWVEAEGGLYDAEVTSTGSLASSNGTLTVRAGNHVTLSGSASANGPLDVAADTNAGGVGDALIAATVSTQGHPINLSAQTVAFSNNVTTSGGGITISSAALTLANAAVLNTAGGAISATLSGSATLGAATITTSGGAINMTAGGTSEVRAGMFTSGGNITLTTSGNHTVYSTLDARGGANTGAVDVRSTGYFLTLASTSAIYAGATTAISGLQGVLINGDIPVASAIDVECFTGNIEIGATAGISNNGALIDFDASYSTITVAAGATITPGPNSLLRFRTRGNPNSLILSVPLASGSGGIELISNHHVQINSSLTTSGPVTLHADADANGSGSLSCSAIFADNQPVILRGSGISVNGPVNTNAGEIRIQPAASTTAVVPAALDGPTRLMSGVTRFTGGNVVGGSLTIDSGAASDFDGPSRSLSPTGFWQSGPLGETRLRIGGTGAGQFNRILSSGAFSAGGKLVVQFEPGYVPAAGHSFQVFQFLSFSGSFASVTLPVLGSGLVWDTSQLSVSGVIRILRPIEAWRQQYFGATAGTGNAADDFDFDNDSLVNLIEFAFGLNPIIPDAANMPQPQRIGNELVYSFTPPAGVSGIIYGAQSSETLAPGDWHPVPDTGTPPIREFRIAIGTRNKDFVRLTITGQAEEFAN